MVAAWLPGSLPGISLSGYGKSLYLRDILLFIIISGNESNEIFQENSQSKIYRPDGSLQVFGGSLPVLPSGLSLYGGSLWKKASSKKTKSVLWWCGSSPGRSPCGKPLSSSLSARPANTSRNGVISGKWQKKLRKNG